ncbi:glycoside hydrolase family 3 C-terminal domain-containing protein [Nocardiopsis trehalosi]|uniref:glycoside hydrolase family 3 C-terminal domain-containing protein n=1 Tax=Nocardiopsis trehalosi TaxID=109329 RepID=UPI0008347ABA|nr:glycoside hydrolase family 3 C-terminal domain-containing protein [Nocardiopsis trehalosi]
MTAAPPPAPGAPTPDEVVAGLSTAEKAALTSGADFWTTTPAPRAGLPAIMLTDGPHGLRKQAEGGDHLGILDSVPATCFPPAVAMAATFDPELVERVGAALGEEAQAEDVHVVLGPGVNIKRSPLCGRNFEYFSEDPLVGGVLGAALVRGVQGRGVGASVKHFAANNQEHDRMRVSADVDERPLREIYLRGFQRVVTEARPWTVMCSYNRVNGVYAAENRWLLTDVLRGEWGFDGLVVSDWGAVGDRVAALGAGLDLQMPSAGDAADARVAAAAEDGGLDPAVLDTAAARVVRLVQRAHAAARPGAAYDPDRHHALAREVAGRAVVLLRNEGGVLPLDRGASVAVIGEFARTPRYQGAGSSLINPTRLDTALDALRDLAGADRIAFAPGFTLDEDPGDTGALTAEAVAAARAADVAVVFLGLPAAAESEGFDRPDLRLPERQTAVLDAVVAANPRTVVVLSNGGVVDLAPFADRVPAIVEGWLLGQAGGGALADVLYGEVNPSGRLTETIPLRLEDTPAFLDFPGEHGHVRYGEGLFVGYRWYDARAAEVRYPFGHGLSYTAFAYSGLALHADGDGLAVRVTVANTGDRAGREVVQVYTGLPGSRVARPPRELKGFATVDLEPGEEREVTVRVDRADLAYWDTRVGAWVVEGGAYTVEAGASSRDIRLSGTVAVDGDEVRVPLSADSSIGELLADPVAAEEAGALLSGDGAAGALIQDEGMLRMLESFPLGRLADFPGSGIDRSALAALIDRVNAERP